MRGSGTYGAPLPWDGSFCSYLLLLTLMRLCFLYDERVVYIAKMPRSFIATSHNQAGPGLSKQRSIRTALTSSALCHEAAREHSPLGFAHTDGRYVIYGLCI